MTDSRVKRDRSGIIYVVATLVGWASILLFLKQLAPCMDAWTSNGWRYGISALLWLPLLLVGLRRGTLPEGLWRRALVPAVFNCIAQACFALPPYYIGAGLSGFLLRISTLFSTGGALLLFADERPLVRNPLFWTGMALVVGGSAGTIFQGSTPVEGRVALGVILGLSAGAFFGLYGLAVRYCMRGIPAMTSFAVISLYTAVGLVAAMLLVSPHHGFSVFAMSSFNWFLLVASALIGIALGHVFYYAAIARLGVAIASGIIQLAPFLTAAGSMLIFGERLTVRQWESGAIMLCGALVLLKAEQHRRAGMEASRPAAPIELEDAGDPTVLSEPPSEDPLSSPTAGSAASATPPDACSTPDACRRT